MFAALRRPTLVITLSGSRTIKLRKADDVKQVAGQAYIMDATKVKHCASYPFCDDEADACITLVLSHWAPDDYFKQSIADLKAQEKTAKDLVTKKNFGTLVREFEMPSYDEFMKMLKTVTAEIQKVHTLFICTHDH